eukprot:scaffold11639_cov172-Amphora_coffeaeformis.AAC.30
MHSKTTCKGGTCPMPSSLLDHTAHRTRDPQVVPSHTESVIVYIGMSDENIASHSSKEPIHLAFGIETIIPTEVSTLDAAGGFIHNLLQLIFGRDFPPKSYSILFL